MSRLPFRFGVDREAYLRGVRRGEEYAQGTLARERGLAEADLRAFQRAHALFWSAEEEQKPHILTVPNRSGVEQQVALAELVKEPREGWLEVEKFIRLFAYGSKWPENKHAEQPKDWPEHLANFYPDDIGRALLGLGFRG